MGLSVSHSTSQLKSWWPTNHSLRSLASHDATVKVPETWTTRQKVQNQTITDAQVTL